MSKVDDELTRRFHRAERPLDSGELFEGIASRRRRRETIRRIEVGFLALAVVVTTAGGFVALRSAFGPDRHQALGGTAFGADGAVVVCTDDTGSHLCHLDAASLAVGATADELVRLTDLPNEIVSMPSVSRDGTTVVFDRSDPTENGTSLWMVGTDGSGLRRLSHVGSGLTNASWGPDGSLVAVASAGTPADQGAAALAILDPARAPDPVVRTIALPGLTFPSTPRFSPDGKEILFAAGEDSNSTGSHLYTVTLDGRVTERGGKGAMTPDWSPDGTRVVFGAGTENGVELFICPLDCSSPRALHDPSEDPIAGGLPRWSLDGGWISFQTAGEDGGPVIRVVRADGSETRSLAAAVGDIAWIPSVASPMPSSHAPTPIVGSAAKGKDVGLGFNLCGAHRRGGIDFLGDGTSGNAWIGARIEDGGTCPVIASGDRLLLAVDGTGDGLADTWIDLPWRCYGYCTPVDATDLDGNGTEELVIRDYLAVIDYRFVAVRANADGKLTIQPIIVAAPGHRPASIEPGRALRINAGGDEGYASSIWCEGYPRNPTLVWAWVLGYVESQKPQEVHITKIRLQSDGLFHVVGTNDYELPATEHWGYGDVTAPACGVDWQPDR